MFVRRLALPLLAIVPAALALPAASSAATGPYPTIRSIAPKKVSVGQTLTIKGSHFRKGKNRNTVVFKRDRGRAVFVRATASSTKRIALVVPAKLLPFFAQKAGAPQPTRFRLRVLAARFGKSFTSNKLTPLVSASVTTPGVPSPQADTDHDGIPDVTDADDDNDGLTDTTEVDLGLRPDVADTDGDGVTDGFEYNSAKDLNDSKDLGTVAPYPGKRPYPNPLDGTDANKDFDGDGLDLIEEYQAWVYMGQPSTYTYSDGTKWSIGGVGNDAMRDSHRDVDEDGLSNWDESGGTLVGPMHEAWWAGVFNGEKTYYGPGFLDTSMTDPDTDGDGIKDGVDDQDHDGYPNWFEVHRAPGWQCVYVSTAVPMGTPGCDGQVHDQPLARVNPFNPCKPIHSYQCHEVYPLGYYGAEDWDTPVGPNDVGPPPSGDPPTLIQ